MNIQIPPDCAADIVDDLAALALAGEASPGTRRFLDQLAGEDPSFAARLSPPSEFAFAPPAAAAEDEALLVLRTVRQFITLRTIFTASGVAFSLLPLTFTFGSGGVEFLFLGKQPGLVASFWSIAAASWVAWGVMHREIRRRGL